LKLMVERNAKTFAQKERRHGTMRFMAMLALLLSVFAVTSTAQQGGGRSAPSLTSEDLLDRVSAYGRASSPARVSTSPISSSTRSAPVSGLYRDPAGAFALDLPSGSWHAATKSQAKGRLSDQRVFRKLDADGFASATASVYILTSTPGFPVDRAARLEAGASRALAEALAARFLSTSASVVSADLYDSGARSGIQVVADQMISRRAVVRALISAFELDGRLYVVVCRAPLESFDEQAREFSAITQSLASSVARSS
jgi:hypothetical protein